MRALTGLALLSSIGYFTKVLGATTVIYVSDANLNVWGIEIFKQDSQNK